MRFLIDNALPPRLADLLVAAGHDAFHVRAYAMQAARDEEILVRALTEDRIIVSADSDFGAILAAQEAEHPSFILFRDSNLLVPSDYMDTLLPAPCQYLSRSWRADVSPSLEASGCGPVGCLCRHENAGEPFKSWVEPALRR